MSLSGDHLRFSYGSRPVLRDVSFSLERGEFLSVIGPNGAGKTTLFRCVLGGLRGYEGQITLDGTDIRTLSRCTLAREIAYIPQIHRPTFGYSVLDTAMMGITHQLSPFAQPGKRQEEQARAALAQMGVEHLEQRDFSQLSGGEQQLVLVARALAQQAGILVMDEPTSALDYGNQLRVLEKVCQLTEQGYAVLLSTHNPQHALSYAHRVLALSDGGVAAAGKPETVLTPDLLERLYGVETGFAETKYGQVIVPVRREERGKC